MRRQAQHVGVLLLCSILIGEPLFAALPGRAAAAPALAPTTRFNEQTLAVGALWMLHAYEPEVASFVRQLWADVTTHSHPIVLGATLIPVALKSSDDGKAKPVKLWDRWTDEKEQRIWNNPPKEITDKINSKAWIRAGHANFVLHVSRKYKGWNNFVRLQGSSLRDTWTREKIDAVWSNPPISVKDKWSPLSWRLAGESKFTSAVQRHYKSWVKFVEIKKNQREEPTELEWLEVAQILRTEDPNQRDMTQANSPLRIEMALARIKDRDKNPNRAVVDALVLREQKWVAQRAEILIAKQHLFVRGLLRDHFDDLVQAGLYGAYVFGNGGLYHAAKRYRADKGARFKTFASLHVDGAIKDAMGKILATSIREGSELPLDAVSDRDEHAVAQTRIQREQLQKALLIVADPRERRVIEGVMRGQTNEELGKILKVNPSRIQQLKTRVIAKIREHFGVSNPLSRKTALSESLPVLILGTVVSVLGLHYILGVFGPDSSPVDVLTAFSVIPSLSSPRFLKRAA